MERHLALYETDPLFNADEPDTIPFGRCGIESHTPIRYPQVDRIRASPQLDLGVFRTTVLNNVPKPLLHYAVKTQRDILGNRCRDFMFGKFYLDAMLFGDFAAEASYRRAKTQLIEDGGVKLVGQSVQVGGEFPGLRPQFVHTLGDPEFGLRYILTESLDLDRQQGKALAEVVMKLSRNLHAFFLLCADQPGT